MRLRGPATVAQNKLAQIALLCAAIPLVKVGSQELQLGDRSEPSSLSTSTVPAASEAATSTATTALQDLALTLGEGDQRWRADVELASDECLGGRADWPAWSPDGGSVAFSSPASVGVEGGPRLDRPWELVVMDPDTLEIRTVVEGVEHARATTWSPDSQQIAYSAEQDGVFVVDVGTGDVRRISAERANWLAWSPDGGELAVAGPAPDSSPTDRFDQLLVRDVSSLGSP